MNSHPTFSLHHLKDESDTVLIRSERHGDEEAIDKLTEMAFAPMPYSSGTEAQIIRHLRASGDLTLSLVAEDGGEMIGHIAFSPVTIDGRHNGWFGLGPIAVRADRQRAGIGKLLIAKGLEWLRQQGASGCVLIGNPDIYSSSGFASDGRLAYGDLDTRYVQRIAFSGAMPDGVLTFASAFDTDAP